MLLLLRAFIAAQWCARPASVLSGIQPITALHPLQRSRMLFATTTSSSSSGTAAGTRVPMKIELREEDIEETFVKGSGPGGQKINKVRNCVQLTHLPTGIMARSQEFRDLTSNRKSARKILVSKLDEHFNGDLSKKAQKIAKIRKSKARNERRRRQNAVEGDNHIDMNEDQGTGEAGEQRPDPKLQ